MRQLIIVLIIRQEESVFLMPKGKKSENLYIMGAGGENNPTFMYRIFFMLSSHVFTCLHERRHVDKMVSVFPSCKISSLCVIDTFELILLNCFQHNHFVVC